MTDQREEFEPYEESVARAIVRVRELFEHSEHLRTAETSIPGCGYFTWHDLWALHDYAARKFENEATEGASANGREP